MEGVLDVGFYVVIFGMSSQDCGEDYLLYGVKVMSQQENSYIVIMLLQLKCVNDWLDQVGDGFDFKLVEIKLCLKWKIYDFLFQYVELVVVVFGNVFFIMVYFKF